MIPNWHFSADPAQNPWLNPYVSMPEGMTQAYTVQPTGGSMAPISVPIPSPLLIPGCPSCGVSGFGYPMIDERPGQFSGQLGNWAWDHRKGIALAAVGLAGLAVLGTLAAILK